MSVTTINASAGDDPAQLIGALVEGVERALPAGVVAQVLEVTRQRSLADRVAGRPGTVQSLTLSRAGHSMTLRLGKGDQLTTEVARVAGGVIISRRTPPLGEWLTVFAGEVGAIAADAAGDAATAARALSALGVRPAGSDVVVDESDLNQSLLALPARVAGRLPDEATALVEKIAGLLRETLPRVEGGGETEYLVQRTATGYLPDTLRAYLALPSDWASNHVLGNGATASQALVSQLSDLEKATARMRDAALESDAQGLLVNGRFLADRFAEPSLDLQ